MGEGFRRPGGSVANETITAASWFNHEATKPPSGNRGTGGTRGNPGPSPGRHTGGDHGRETPRPAAILERGKRQEARVDDELIRWCALATHEACMRMTAPHLKALQDPKAD